MIRKLLKNQKNLEKTAIIERACEVSFGELKEKSKKIESQIFGRKKKNVAIFLPNGSDFIAAFFAVIGAGHTAFPINILLTPHEALCLLRRGKADAVITSEDLSEVFEGTDIEVIIVGTLGLFRHCEEDEVRRGNPVLASESFFQKKFLIGKQKKLSCSDEKPMILLSTSGTTGTPKIVQLSEKNVQTAVLGYLDKLVFDEVGLEKSRYIVCLPFSSVYAIMIICACLFYSFPIIVLEDGFTLGGLFVAADKYAATHYEGSASPIILMEKMIGKQIDCGNSLRFFGFGGSKVAGATIAKVQEAYKKFEFYQGYGMTESAPLITKHSQKANKEFTKFDSVGTAIKGVKIAVDDGEKITDKPFITGEIVASGDNVMLGYLGNQAETDRIIRDGYLYTGDIGYLDEEGYLYISGRKKNIIIVRGYNVYPEEIEECILSSKLAVDCLVFGESDKQGNETVCAKIVPSGETVTEKEIIDICRKKLAEYKIPRKIILVPTIEKNANGKTQRK